MVNEVVVGWSKTAAKVRVQNNLPVQKIIEKIDGRLLGRAKTIYSCGICFQSC